MGQVIRFSDYQKTTSPPTPRGHDSLIPVELALGVEDEQACLETVARYGNCQVFPRLLSDGSGAVLYLIKVSDAIELNRQILESGELDAIEQACCMDLIQMLENVNESLLQEAWGSTETNLSSYSQ